MRGSHIEFMRGDFQPEKNIGNKPSDKTQAVIDYVKSKKRVYKTEVQKHFGFDYSEVTRYVDYASTAKGSRIYSEKEGHKVVLAWL
jgi:hypothetical protein